MKIKGWQTVVFRDGDGIGQTGWVFYPTRRAAFEDVASIADEACVDRIDLRPRTSKEFARDMTRSKDMNKANPEFIQQWTKFFAACLNSKGDFDPRKAALTYQPGRR
ncbi:MAG: hypothetical protein WCA19_07170 [Candidatus Acidiferrales bacterium]